MLIKYHWDYLQQKARLSLKPYFWSLDFLTMQKYCIAFCTLPIWLVLLLHKFPKRNYTCAAYSHLWRNFTDVNFQFCFSTDDHELLGKLQPSQRSREYGERLSISWNKAHHHYSGTRDNCLLGCIPPKRAEKHPRKTAGWRESQVNNQFPNLPI